MNTRAASRSPVARKAAGTAERGRKAAAQPVATTRRQPVGPDARSTADHHAESGAAATATPREDRAG